MKSNPAQEKNGMKPLGDLAEAALKNYEQAMQTTLKLQEETGKWWTSMLDQAAWNQEWQKRLNSMSGAANSLAPLAQQRMEEVISLMEKNSRTGAELMKKAVEAAQSPAVAESQAKWMDFWTSSIGVARANTQAFTEISAKAIDSWIAFIQMNSQKEVKAAKAATA
jgi:hypothetical protein